MSIYGLLVRLHDTQTTDMHMLNFMKTTLQNIPNQ